MRIVVASFDDYTVLWKDDVCLGGMDELSTEILDELGIDYENWCGDYIEDTEDWFLDNDYADLLDGLQRTYETRARSWELAKMRRYP